MYPFLIESILGLISGIFLGITGINHVGIILLILVGTLIFIYQTFPKDKKRHIWLKNKGSSQQTIAKMRGVASWLQFGLLASFARGIQTQLHNPLHFKYATIKCNLKNRSCNNIQHDWKTKKQIRPRTKAEYGSLSLQPSLRCHTLLFFPARQLCG